MHIGYKKRENRSAGELEIAIVGAAAHPDAVSRLVNGAEADFLQAGGLPGRLRKVFLQTSDDLLQSTSDLARSGNFQAIVVLEALLREELQDPDQYSTNQTIFLSRLARETGVIITTGTICAHNLAQIEDRIGGAAGHKGREAMTAAIEVAHAMQEIQNSSAGWQGKQGVLLLGAAWHDEQVSRLIKCAEQEYLAERGRAANVVVCRAAGSLELPFLAAQAIKTGKFSAILCCGLILVGGTNHADILSETIEAELSELRASSKIPIKNATLLVSSYAEAEKLLAEDENNVGKNAMRDALREATHHEA